ncbi:MAG: hypothetical protein II939_09355 [Bacteroidales bacterium]|nr:hypothetical protein [Bacteroidales bacterium]
MEPNGTAELQTAIIRKILSLYDFNILKQLLTSLDNYTNEDGNFPDFGPHSIEEAYHSIAEAEQQFAKGNYKSNEEVLAKIKQKYSSNDNCLV